MRRVTGRKCRQRAGPGSLLRFREEVLLEEAEDRLFEIPDHAD